MGTLLQFLKIFVPDLFGVSFDFKLFELTVNLFIIERFLPQEHVFMRVIGFIYIDFSLNFFFFIDVQWYFGKFLLEFLPSFDFQEFFLHFLIFPVKVEIKITFNLSFCITISIIIFWFHVQSLLDPLNIGFFMLFKLFRIDSKLVFVPSSDQLHLKLLLHLLFPIV